MADQKKDFGLKGTTNTANPKPALKQELESNIINDETVENIVQKVHSSTSKLIRLSLDVTPEMYDAIKRKQIDKKYKTTRDYIISLITTDVKEYLNDNVK